VRDFGFEVDGVVDLDSGDIELKLSFWKDDWVNRREEMIGKGFDGCTVSTNMYLLTKIWAIRHYIRLGGILQILINVKVLSSCHGQESDL
jgi:hypothetical protein